jgi:hypothetical protein
VVNKPSPCPQCQSERIWARAAFGPHGVTQVAFCPGCARAATLCSRCGGDLVMARQSSWIPRAETVLTCRACRYRTPLIPEPPPKVPAARGPLGRLLGGASAPARMQRVADDLENQASRRYVQLRGLLGVVVEVVQRADALARLDAELAHLDRLPAKG